MTTPPPDSGNVAIRDFDFAPQVVHVAVGTTVTWVNGGVAPHTVTAADGAFDSGFLNTGESFSRQFTAEGVVEYLCAIHPAMIGTVVVGAAPVPGSGGGATASPPVTGGQPGAGAGGGSGGPGGGKPSAIVPEAPLAPLTTEQLLRIGFVLAISVMSAGAFALTVRSTARGA